MMHAVFAMIAVAVIASLISSTAEGHAEMALKMQPINRAATFLSVIIWATLIAGWIWQ